MPAKPTKTKPNIKTSTECVCPILPPTLNPKYNVSLRAYAKIFTYRHGKKMSSLNSLLSHKGNLKIPPTTAIFNCGSATDCPSLKLGLCAAAEVGVKCYAKKTEYEYHPFVLPYRRRQAEFWKETDANEFVCQFLMINSLKGKPFTSLRLNESGDFYSQDCVDKAEEISRLLSKFGIKVYCYTSRKDLTYEKCKNLIVSGSGFTKKGISNIFQIIKSIKDKPKGWAMCKGNCRICNMCLTRNRKICVLAH